MFNRLAEAVLKTGERMEIGVITAPDARHAEEVKTFLGHKPGNYKWHIERCIIESPDGESLDALETRFYVGKLDGKVIANIMTVEHEGIGILGHVFTLPAQRRKGACKGVMAHQMEDFRQRGGRALYLGTGYNSAPYHIYHSFGFKSVLPASGFMHYYVNAHVNADFAERYFARAPAKPKPVEWHDWPKVTALSAIVGWDTLRSLTWGVYGPTNLEGGFLAFKHDLETADIYADAKLLVARNGAIVGWATVTWDARWRGTSAVLDIFFHPNFADAVPTLLSDLTFPDAKVQCYVDEDATVKADILTAAGFGCEARLREQFAYNGRRYDVLVFNKR